MNISELIIQRKKEKIFKAVGSVADSISRECYAVGGCVRDMMLDRPSVDIDFVSVGNGIELAEAVARSMGKGTHLSVFRNVGTAPVKRGEMERAFGGARKESYDRQSRTPIVEGRQRQHSDIRRSDRSLRRHFRPQSRHHPHTARP